MHEHRMPALRTMALVLVAVWGSTGHAAGLGSAHVQSALGQPLRLSIPLLGNDAGDLNASCVKARLEHSDGVFITGAQVAFSRANQTTMIHLATRQPVNEPAVAVTVEVTCGTSIQRTYQVLLDPVVMLPQLAQSGQSNRADQSARNAPLALPMVAPAEASPQTDGKRQRLSRRKTQDAASGPAAVVRAELAPARPARAEPRTVVRNVLKLSGDDLAIDDGATFSPGLKLSDTLSESHDTGDPQRAAELRAAYSRFAAVMRGEDPVQNGEAQLQAMQAKLQELEKQTALMRQQGEVQRQADRAATDSMRRESSGWMFGMGGLLLAALAAIGWLLWRSHDASGRRPGAFWDKTAIEPDDEPDDEHETRVWEDTLATIGTIQGEPEENSLHDDPPPSDWEKGVPQDDTLAIDWAAGQATVQSETLQPQSADIPASAAGHTAAASGMSLADQPVAENLGVAPAASSPAATAAVKHREGMHLLQVEELSGLMQEAEFWMLLNDSQRAIEILEPYAEVKQPVSPVPWIYLLDLYRVADMQEKYEALGRRIKQVCNTSVPAWEDLPDYASARSLEDYPHVIEAIQDLWEGEYIVPYLESLLFDDRAGARSGFDLAVYREIIHLIGIAGDPDRPQRRTQLSFGKSQPRLISQQVTSQADKLAGVKVNDPAVANGMDVFDRATSQQATFRQALPRMTVPKAGTPKSVVPPPAAPAAPVIAEPGMAAPAAVSQAMEIPQALSVEEVIKAKRAAFVAQQKAAAFVPDADRAEDDDNDHFSDMARKIDLATAYQEIGENVGARVLLDEVIQGGTPIQADKAKVMLKKLLKEIDWQ